MKTETCPRCFGRGEIRHHLMGLGRSYMNGCLRCNGTGRAAVPPGERHQVGWRGPLFTLLVLALLAALVFILLGCGAPRAPMPGGEALPLPEIEPREWDYQQVYCNKPGWELEKVLSDGTRADCLNPTHAIELDRVYKWRQCLDQAEHYARLTGKKPMCVLILDRDITTTLHDRIRRAARERGVTLDWIQ